MDISGGATNADVFSLASFGSNAILTGTNTVANFFVQHTAYLDTGAVLNVSGTSANTTLGSLFGPGTLNVASGTFQWGFPSSTITVGAIQLNSKSTGYSLVTDAGSTQVFGGIPLSQATFVAPAGDAGFGGYAFGGGATITNGAQP